MKKFRIEAQVVLEVEIDESDFDETDEESLEDCAINEAELQLFGFDDYYINCVEEI